MKLDVIIPCYNEEGNVELLYKKLIETLGENNYQLIFINDGSVDQTYSKLKNLYEQDKSHVKVINFSRNFGKDAAMYAGLNASTAEYAVIIDSDLQQNPKYLNQMLAYLESHEDVDQVAMINKKRAKEGLITRFLKRSFYTFINLISETKLAADVSDFRMFRKNMIEAICSLSENNRFSKGIFAWVGFNTYYMEYEVEKRHSGKAFYSSLNQWKYAFNGIVNFSVKPLKLPTFFGLITSLSGFIYLVTLIIKALFTDDSLAWHPALLGIILLISGIQLIALGILGEYLAKAFYETKKRPAYITKNKLGFNDELL